MNKHYHTYMSKKYLTNAYEMLDFKYIDNMMLYCR